MNRPDTTSAAKARPGLAGRLYAWIHGGWRKVMTGMAAVLALALAYHVIFGQNGLTVYQKKRQETHALTQRLHSLQHENDIMKGHVERLENDPNAIEHQAREELHYTRPGEVIYTLPPETAKNVTAQSGVAKP